MKIKHHIRIIFYTNEKNSKKKAQESDKQLLLHINKHKIIFIFIIIIYFLVYSFWKKSIKLRNNLIEHYIKAQKDFCENPKKYINTKYEDEIFLSDVKLNDLSFQMYIFKSNNFILNEFKSTGAFEIPLSKNMIEALKFYGSKKKIGNNKDILMLDIGGNVGWYPSLLGRYGYTILSFEAFEKNYYVSKKNYCHLNKNSNVVIITKGLGVEQKTCQYFIHLHNAGNGMVKCDINSINNIGLKSKFIKENFVEITTLNSFIPYLSNKNIALMKLDVEGHELEVLNGGKELITKYHVPFVVSEFSPSFLREIGSVPRQLAQFFVNNGYKISIEGFLSKNYTTVDKLLNKAGFQINCYFIHDSIIKSISDQ